VSVTEASDASSFAQFHKDSGIEAMGRAAYCVAVWTALSLSSSSGMPARTNSSGEESGRTLPGPLVDTAISNPDATHSDLVKLVKGALLSSALDCSVVSSTSMFSLVDDISVFSLVGHVKSTVPRAIDVNIRCDNHAALERLKSTDVRSTISKWMEARGILQAQDADEASVGEDGQPELLKLPSATAWRRIVLVAGIVAVVLGILVAAVRSISAEQARLKFWINVETALLQGTNLEQIEIPNKLVEVELANLAEHKTGPQQSAQDDLGEYEGVPLVSTQAGPMAVLEINSTSARCEVRKVLAAAEEY